MRGRCAPCRKGGSSKEVDFAEEMLLRIYGKPVRIGLSKTKNYKMKKVDLTEITKTTTKHFLIKIKLYT